MRSRIKHLQALEKKKLKAAGQALKKELEE
jgi:hypothetical protein